MVRTLSYYLLSKYTALARRRATETAVTADAVALTAMAVVAELKVVGGPQHTDRTRDTRCAGGSKAPIHHSWRSQALAMFSGHLFSDSAEPGFQKSSGMAAH